MDVNYFTWPRTLLQMLLFSSRVLIIYCRNRLPVYQKPGYNASYSAFTSGLCSISLFKLSQVIIFPPYLNSLYDTFSQARFQLLVSFAFF